MVWSDYLYDIQTSTKRMHVMDILVFRYTFWNKISMMVFRWSSASIGSEVMLSVNMVMFSGEILLRIDKNFFRISFYDEKSRIDIRS